MKVDKKIFMTRTEDFNNSCLYCKYSAIHQPQSNAKNSYGNTNYHFICEPTEENEQQYLIKYFKEHKIKKTIGYIGLITNGEFPYLYTLKTKTTPKWCPKKKKEAQEPKLMAS